MFGHGVDCHQAWTSPNPHAMDDGSFRLFGRVFGKLHPASPSARRHTFPGGQPHPPRLFDSFDHAHCAIGHRTADDLHVVLSGTIRTFLDPSEVGPFNVSHLALRIRIEGAPFRYPHGGRRFRETLFL